MWDISHLAPPTRGWTSFVQRNPGCIVARTSVTLPKARDKLRGGKKTGTQAPPAVENRVSFLKQGLTGIKKWFAKP